ncbi:cyclic nucleotide-binding domain-containing protein [Pseudoalteromonas sp. T1lg48]|uniref:cyclic nucleotide-binding domain-containing protein n=1 Tax=Pseudoalteromonas sp. T1lg48 TaxID=2077100 RepID=UPI000CF71EDC|nr:cyclic nucleotide-binding domain-containing protein [Pseudoalteromonas sp. T1lg48]
MRLLENIAMFKRMEIINRVPFFRDFELAERQMLLESFSHWYMVRQGQYVFKQHEQQNQYLYIVLSGELIVFRQHDMKNLGHIHPGEFVGEGAFISHRERSTNARAKVDTVVLAIDPQALFKLPVVVREKIKDQLLVGMSERIAKLSSGTNSCDVNETPATPASER